MKTGRFRPANGAARARAVKRAGREQRLLGLDPAKVAPWLRPFVDHARAYAEMLAASTRQDALSALAGDVAIAATIARALVAAATGSERPDIELLAEARGWLREHRTALSVLAALSDGVEPDDQIDPRVLENMTDDELESLVDRHPGGPTKASLNRSPE